MYPTLYNSLNPGLSQAIPPERNLLLTSIAQTLKEGLLKENHLHLRFVCTHNARRSQLSQFICQALAFIYQVPISTSSAGTQKTRVHPSVVEALKHLGFNATKATHPPYEYLFHIAENQAPLIAYSKTLEEAALDEKTFWAIMVCNQADADCPYVPGASQRLVLPYTDPGAKDGTPEELEAYETTALTIAAEWRWMFQSIAAL